MKYIRNLLSNLLPFLEIFVSWVFSQPSGETHFASVTELDNLEDFYHHIFMKGPEMRFHRRPRESTAQRQAICQSITSSSYFEMYNEGTVNPEEIYTELKFRHRKIFHKIYEKEAKSCCFCFTCNFGCCSKYYYRNNYDQRDVRASNRVVKEWVFLCLTEHWQRKPRRITPYYVSEEYNISEVRTSKDHYIAGRFIFVSNGDKLELRALAEEGARPPKHMDGNVEDHYLRVRTHFKPSRRQIDDPVCMMPRKNKVRLCSSVLSSSSFKSSVKFFPDMKYVSNTCNRREVLFRTPGAIEKVEQGRNLHFEEWMIACQALEIVDEVEMSVEYLISTAYESNKVFVYSWNQPLENTYLVNLSTHVNVNLDGM